MKNGLYKYVCDGEIIYIGKSDSNVLNRIRDHKKEQKFKPYLEKGCEIYICELPNSTETLLVEKALINQYKPILNGSNNSPGFSSLIKISEPKWTKYDENEIKAKKAKQKNQKDVSNSLPPIPDELVNSPRYYWGNNRIRRREIELMICPNGSLYCEGYQSGNSEQYRHPKFYYKRIRCNFELNSLEELENLSKQDPKDVYLKLKCFCEKILFCDYNLGEKYLLIPQSNYDILFALGGYSFSEEQGFARFHISPCYNKDKTAFLLDKSFVLKLYLALSCDPHRKNNYGLYKRLYFSIHHLFEYNSDDISTIFHYCNIFDRNIISARKHEIEKMYDDFRLYWNDYCAENRYNQMLNAALSLYDNIRCVVILNNEVHIINKKEKRIINGVICRADFKSSKESDKMNACCLESKWSDGKFEIPRTYYNSYPYIYLLEQDYKKIVSILFERGIPIAHIDKMMLVNTKNKTTVDIPEDYFDECDSWSSKRYLALRFLIHLGWCQW